VRGKATEALPILRYFGDYELLEEKYGSEVICSASSAYDKIAGGIVVESSFAKQKPEVVKRVLASWFSAVEYLNDKNHKDEAIEYTRNFFLTRGIDLSWESLEKHHQNTGLFGLDHQLELMKLQGSGNSAGSIFDSWILKVGDFIVEKDIQQEQPDPRLYIMDDFLKMIQEDSQLYDFARGLDRPDYGVPVPTAAVFYEAEHSGGATASLGFLLGFVILCAFSFMVVKHYSPLSYLKQRNRENQGEYSPVDTSPGYIELADSHELTLR
jgi:hypothetical protein